MSRGGARNNAGRKSGWVNLETKLIRVPVAIESQLMAIAKKLDQGESIESVTESKTIDVENVTNSENPNNDLVTKSIVSSNESVTNSESSNNDLVTDSKVFQTELIPIVLQSNKLEPLSQTDLAIRFKVSDRAIRNHKSDLLEWSKSKDPDDIAWEYRAEKKKYYPLNM